MKYGKVQKFVGQQFSRLVPREPRIWTYSEKEQARVLIGQVFDADNRPASVWIIEWLGGASQAVRLALIRRVAGRDPCNASRLMLMEFLMEVDEDNTIV